jgi:hypothetical protein
MGKVRKRMKPFHDLVETLSEKVSRGRRSTTVSTAWLEAPDWDRGGLEEGGAGRFKVLSLGNRRREAETMTKWLMTSYDFCRREVEAMLVRRLFSLPPLSLPVDIQCFKGRRWEV